MNGIVEYDQLVAFLKQASVFEIYRITVALQNELEQPQRLAKVTQKIKEGDILEYFDLKTNAFIKALILQKFPKKVLVRHLDDGRQCQIPLFWLKIDSREFSFAHPAEGLNKNAVKIGDLVGFYHPNLGEDITGLIERRNQKTVSILTATKKRWRVPYRLLYAIIDGQKGASMHRIDHVT